MTTPRRRGCSTPCKARHFAKASEIAAATGLGEPIVQAALTAYTQAGRVMYDLDKGVFRLRELAREPLPMGALRFASPQEEKADRFVEAKLVTIKATGERDGKRVITGEVLDDAKTYSPMIVLDGDDRMVEARCDCYFYGHNKMMRGPCEHMLALRRLYHDVAGGAPATSTECGESAMNGLRGRGNMLDNSPMRGACRSGPCIMGGVSPSLHHARQSVTGPIFTGPALAHHAVLQLGFVEPKPARWAVPASSGPTQSQDQTKASRPAPLNFPLSFSFPPLPRGEGLPMTDATTSQPGSLTRQQLYDRIRETSKDEFILDEMIRLGYWPGGKGQPSLPEELIRRSGEIRRELDELVRKQRLWQDPERALKEMHKQRKREAMQRRQETKVKNAQARLDRAMAWRERRKTDVLYLGAGVSGGLSAVCGRPRDERLGARNRERQGAGRRHGPAPGRAAVPVLRPGGDPGSPLSALPAGQEDRRPPADLGAHAPVEAGAILGARQHPVEVSPA